MRLLFFRLKGSGLLGLYLSILILLLVSQVEMSWGGTGDKSVEGLPDWSTVAKIAPSLKTLVLVETSNGLNLQDLAALAAMSLVPADRDPGLVIGLKKAVFATTAQKWINSSFPSHISARLLPNFIMTGIYRVSFRVEAKDYDGPLKLEVTAPREDVGKRLVSSDIVIRPVNDFSIHGDSAGNRWVSLNIPRVKYGDVIKFHFSYSYEVDVSQVIGNDLLLSQEPVRQEIGTEFQEFLKKGYKIDPGIPQAVKWAGSKSASPVDARHEYTRLSRFLKAKIAYDHEKRAAYFGGQSVYTNLDEMYRPPVETLSRGSGCCPDTVLLECCFMRAKGIPCRTAGRFGHFFSELYLSGRGWKSTSTTPTGIPLIKARGADHLPFQKWEPNIALRTTRWEARMRIVPMEVFR